MVIDSNVSLPSLNALVEPAARKESIHDCIITNPNAGSPIELAQNNPDYLQLILTARVYDVAIETPLQKAFNLSTRLNNNFLLKREDLQPVFSFKLRGAYNRMVQLSQEERDKGVIACSAGNHAQGNSNNRFFFIS